MTDSTTPPVRFDGDLQVAKRELIKLGLEQGSLTRAQIAEHLPLEHLSEVEIEVLTFTFESLGIRVEGV